MTRRKDDVRDLGLVMEDDYVRRADGRDQQRFVREVAATGVHVTYSRPPARHAKVFHLFGLV